MSFFPGFSVEEGKAVLRHAKDIGLDAVDLGLNLRFFGKQPAAADAYERFAVQVMREMLNG